MVRSRSGSKMIFDSHAHSWANWPYEPPVPDPSSRGGVANLLWEMDRAGVDRAVLVSANIDHNPENNAYVADAARAHPERLVQFADVDSKWSKTYHAVGAAGRLARVAEFFRPAGITHYLGAENDGWLISDEGFAFFGEAERRGLIMSVAGAPLWQEDLRRVAQAFPRLVILCHHLAGIPSAGLTDRSQALASVIRSVDCPNIYIKASGFYYGSNAPFNVPNSEGVEIFRSLYEVFGFRRFVWGSDYPVAPMRAYTYRQSLEMIRHHCPFVDEEALAAIAGDTLDSLLAGAHT